MSIVLTRVDSRLIHGQVAVAWVKNVNAKKIMVIDDETSNDEMQRMLLELATPSGVSTAIYNLKEGAEALKTEDTTQQNTMVILKNPDAILFLIENGVILDSVNIGGMYFEEGKNKIEKALFVSEHDLEVFRALKEKGVKLYYQVAPMNKKQDLYTLID